MADTTLTPPRLAKETDAAALASLFCTGEKEIGLKPYVCGDENRPQLIGWLETECSAGQLWTMNSGSVPLGMLILHDISRRADRKKHEITYVVVGPAFRGNGIGPALVRHIQAQSAIIRWLRAEARNPHSEYILAKCGFQQDGKYMVWRQPRRKRPRSEI